MLMRVARLRPPRFTVPLWGFVLLVAIAMTFLSNMSLLRHVATLIPVDTFSGKVFFAAVPLFIVAVTALLIAPLISHRFGKWIVALLFVINALIGYLMSEFGASVNRGTIDSFLETSPREALHLVNAHAIWHVALLAVLPALALGFVHVRRASTRGRRWRETLIAPALAGATLALLAALFYKDFATLGSHDHQLINKVVPGNYLVGTTMRLRERWQTPGKFLVLSEDAKQIDATGSAKSLLVIVVGETARAKNFSMYGYARDTNPEMRARGAIALQNAHSCDTVTVYSVPCMFSNMTRNGFNAIRANYQSNLLDVLVKAGVAVEWIDNDAGCKGVCARVPSSEVFGDKNSRWCANGECLDEILVEAFDSTTSKPSAGSRVIVLHAMGSHGPNYYSRYPDEYKRFTPACEEEDLRRCTKESLENAYSNTIAYTDHINALLIDRLKALESTGAFSSTALIYVSDHGESLGENGLYLHGVPYPIAPKEQKEIPFIVWLSQGMRTQNAIDDACLRDHAQKGSFSHDHLFHSTLGLMNIATSLYRTDLDAFAPCTKKRAPTAQ